MPKEATAGGPSIGSRWLIGAALAAAAVALVGFGWLGSGDVRFVSSARVDLPVPPAASGMVRQAGPEVGPAPVAAVAAADSELIEPSPFGPLPRIAADGGRPFFAYASDFDLQDSRPKVAVLVQDLGLQRDLTAAALRLPARVSLQFSPYAPDLEGDVAAARADGHEVMLALPMEPPEYPASDPGPHTLLADAAPAENVDRLHWVLSRTTGYVGLAGAGGRFGTSPAARPVISELARRGLALVEIGSGSLTEEAREAGLLYARAAAPVDADPSPLAIDYALAALEAEALETGSALGVVSAFPVSIARLERWIGTLEAKGLALAPVSALLIEGAGLAARLRGQGGDVEPGHG